MKVQNEGLSPHLWMYRQRISLEHLRLNLKEETLKNGYPILYTFLQMVSYSNNLHIIMYTIAVRLKVVFFMSM